MGSFEKVTVGELVKIENTSYQHHYHSIVLHHINLSGLRSLGISLVFQRSTDSKHSLRQYEGRLTKKESEGVSHQMTWP